MGDINDAINGLNNIAPQNLDGIEPRRIETPSKVQTQTGQTVILNDGTVNGNSTETLHGSEHYAKRSSNSSILGNLRNKRY